MKGQEKMKSRRRSPMGKLEWPFSCDKFFLLIFWSHTFCEREILYF